MLCLMGSNQVQQDHFRMGAENKGEVEKRTSGTGQTQVDGQWSSFINACLHGAIHIASIVDTLCSLVHPHIVNRHDHRKVNSKSKALKLGKIPKLVSIVGDEGNTKPMKGGLREG